MSRRPSASRPSTRPGSRSSAPSPRPRRETAAEPELLGLRAVVTGASSGIGRAIALELAAGGADVLVSARASREEADETARRIRELSRGTAVVMADLSTPAGCDGLLEAAWRRLERVDIWVNNAGADILTGEGWKLDF